MDSAGAVWTLSGQIVLRNGVDTGGRGTPLLYCNRFVYVFGLDNQWWRWNGSWAAVGVVDPCGAPTPTPTPTPTTESPNNTRVPPATQIVDSAGAVWTRAANGAILRNGVQAAGGFGSQILYCSRIIYVFGTDSQWWRWNGSWSPVGTVDPCGGGGPTPTPTPTPATESPNNTRVPPGTRIVDSVGAVWTLSGQIVLRNGVDTGGRGTQLLYCNHFVYVFGQDNRWWRWNGSWAPIGTVDPCGPG